MQFDVFPKHNNCVNRTVAINISLKFSMNTWQSVQWYTACIGSCFNYYYYFFNVFDVLVPSIIGTTACQPILELLWCLSKR